MSSSQASGLETLFPLDQEVEAIVRRVEPFGVFVQLVDAEWVTGFVKRHDWDWSWRGHLVDRVRVGESIRAKVVEHERPGRLRLSRRDLMADPFTAFVDSHQVGQTVLGEFSLLAQNAAGVVLTLDNGAEGFIPRSEIPQAFRHLDGFGLVSRDRVAAQILRFDSAESSKRVILSVRQQLASRDARDSAQQRARRTSLRYHPVLGVQLERLYWHYQLGEVDEPSVSPVVRQRLQRILLVEDSEAVSTSLEMVFRHFGLSCDVATSLDAARDRLGRRQYDLLILDLNLSAEEGAELLSELRGSASPILIFVLTAAAAGQLQELRDQAQGLVVSVFQKPTGVGEIFAHLEERLDAEGRVRPGFVEISGPGDQESLPPAPEGWTRRQHSTDRRVRIEELLSQLQTTTGADYVCLMARGAGQVFELAAGSFRELTREVQQSLEISPVGNIIKERGCEVIADTRRRESWFRHLHEVVPVRSFAGVALDYQDQRRYGLFLIGKEARQLREIDPSRLRAHAQTLGNLLAEIRLDEALAENQGLLLTGFLSDSLLHEIKNELQTLDNHATLQLILGRKHGDEFGAMSDEEVRDFTRASAEIQKVSQRLNQLVVLFGNLAGRSPAERIGINQTVQRLQTTLRPFARKSGAQVQLELEEGLPEVRVNPRFLEQPLLNVMINGLEQMALGGSSTRLLRVGTEFHRDAEFPLAVTISDTGPGIHRVDWEKVFDLFFTTKEKGTGLGLYLSRFFVERFGGRLVLRDSLRFTGSVFAIEIPKEVLV